MKNRVNNNGTISTDNKIENSIKKLNAAETVAWALFVGVGIAYIVLSLVLPNNV
jgi:hypothetical protein